MKTIMDLNGLNPQHLRHLIRCHWFYYREVELHYHPSFHHPGRACHQSRESQIPPLEACVIIEVLRASFLLEISSGFNCTVCSGVPNGVKVHN